MKEIKQVLLAQLLSNNKKAMGIIGPPGVGKSDIIKQLAKDLGRKIIEERVGYKSPGDLLGLPMAVDIKVTKDKIYHIDEEVPDNQEYRIEKVTKFLVSEWLLKLQLEENSILVLEELTNASPEVIGVMYELLLDWSVNNTKIPSSCNIIFTGNRLEDASSIVSQLESTIFTRATILSLTNDDVSFEDWKEWAIQNEIHPSVLAFLNLYNHYLIKEPIDGSSYCTPRTWAILSQNLYDHEKLRPPVENTKAYNLWESGVKKVILANVPEAAADFQIFYLDGIKSEKPEYYIANPNKYLRDDELFMQISYGIAYYINNTTKFDQSLLDFFKSIYQRDSKREYPILMGILYSLDSVNPNSWFEKLQRMDLNKSTELAKYVNEALNHIKKLSLDNL